MHPLCPTAHCTKSKDGNVMRALTPLYTLLFQRETALFLNSGLLCLLLLIQLLKVHHQILVSLASISNLRFNITNTVSSFNKSHYNILLEPFLFACDICCATLQGTNISSHHIPLVIKIVDNSKLLLPETCYQ